MRRTSRTTYYRRGLARAITAHPRLVLAAVADGGLTALSLIIERRPDLALLDVRLPRLDGFAISKRLLSCEPRLATRVLLLAAVLDETQRARARGVGAVDCLSKDASRWEICDALLAAAEREKASPLDAHGGQAGEVGRPVTVIGAPNRVPGPDGRAA